MLFIDKDCFQCSGIPASLSPKRTSDKLIGSMISFSSSGAFWPKSSYLSLF